MVVTNAVGAVFTAALLAASDGGVTFVFPEDGKTNTLQWTQLSAASQSAVCAAADFTPVPPALQSAYRMARVERRRLEALAAENRIDAAEAANRRQRLGEAFSKACRKRQLPEAQIERLLKRLDSGD